MAVDEALLLSVEKGSSPPTLRFFAWDAPSLSIGSFQKAEELDLNALSARGVPLVRRPTGGRAVLHDAELTYSVACPIPSVFFPSDLMGSYKKIGACFLAGLKGVGLEAALVPVDREACTRRGRSHNPLCFSSPSWYEVLAGGKKLIGSAQRRLRGAFLQQGSLLIGLDVEGLVSLMRYGSEADREAARAALVSKMTALNEHQSGVDIERLKGALVEGFEMEMGVSIEPGSLTKEETALAKKLLREKYSREEWILRRAMGA